MRLMRVLFLIMLSLTIPFAGLGGCLPDADGEISCAQSVSGDLAAVPAGTARPSFNVLRPLPSAPAVPRRDGFLSSIDHPPEPFR
jgi:hypothetical protein